jgi:5-methylcytosine-specific restriction endonuclease McrA
MRNNETINPYAIYLDESQIKAERHKARELRASQWWKRRCAKGRCHWCHRPTPAGELTMDHIIPISRGGKSTKGNLVPACKGCNTQKKQLLPMEWEAYLQTIRRNGET